MWNRGPDAFVVVVLAPGGRDGALASQMLAQAGLTAVVCADFDTLLQRMQEPIGAILVTEDVLTEPHVVRLSNLLASQPPWSDLPVVVFAATANRLHGDTAERVAPLGNVTFVDRPVQRRTMVTAVRTALRSRNRQYEARRAIEARDQFLAMLGHELRNPLSAILLAADLVNRSGVPDSGAGKHFAVIERQARHLGRLVDDLLDVARVTSGKVVLKREALDLVALAGRCLQAVDLSARTRGVRVSIDSCPQPLTVEGDVVRLEQVVTNLLANAVRYTPRGGSIRVHVDQRDGEAVLRVRDSGVGIAPDQLDAIFGMFVQAPGALDRATGGLGLGLTLVRALVEMHAGTVVATSDGPGKGSEFTVRLPGKAATVAKSDRAAVPAASAELRRRIVVVEDNADIRDMLQEALTASGHDVETAPDGPAGLSRVLASHPDVALVDIGLPGFDGYHLARAVRTNSGNAIFLVAMTGYGQPDDRARAFDAGFDEHLTKPVDLDVLEHVLQARGCEDADGKAPRTSHAVPS